MMDEQDEKHRGVFFQAYWRKEALVGDPLRSGNSAWIRMYEDRHDSHIMR